MLMGEVRAEGLLRAIDPVVRAGLSLKQEDAIRAAARQEAWQAYPIDLRLMLPSPFGRRRMVRPASEPAPRSLTGWLGGLWVAYQPGAAAQLPSPYAGS